MIIIHLDVLRRTETDVDLRVVDEMLVAVGVSNTESRLFPCRNGRQVQVATSLLVATAEHLGIVRPFAEKRAVPL